MDSIIKSWLERDYELIALGSVNWHAKSGKKEVKNHFHANGTIYNDKQKQTNKNKKKKKKTNKKKQKLSRKLRY